MRPPRFDTAQLSLVRTPFDDPDFLFELKHDGFRALAHIWDGNCELVSRKRNAYKSFNELRENLAKLKVQNAVIEKHFGTVEQFKRHLTEDVLPPLLDKLSQTVRELGEGERHDETDIQGQGHHASE
jgi:hypothetical protein